MNHLIERAETSSEVLFLRWVDCLIRAWLKWSIALHVNTLVIGRLPHSYELLKVILLGEPFKHLFGLHTSHCWGGSFLTKWRPCNSWHLSFRWPSKKSLNLLQNACTRATLSQVCQEGTQGNHTCLRVQFQRVWFLSLNLEVAKTPVDEHVESVPVNVNVNVNF